jgi:ATP-dependent Clp protease ATP-binding subunit ClpA
MEKIGFASDKSDKANYDEAKAKVLEALKDHFRPEFLNRLDEIVVFDILSKGAVSEIVKIQIGIVRERLLQKEIKISLSDAVLAHLSKEGYSPQYGARPLKRLIQTNILTPIASLMVSRGLMKGGAITVDIKEGKFTFSVKKGKHGPFVTNGFVQEGTVV